MIFVSQYLLSLMDCKSMRITDTYSLHRVVYDLFENIRQDKDYHKSSGILFVDKGTLRGMRRLLIVSNREPLNPKFGILEKRELKPSFLDFSSYRFECVLNPVRRDAKTKRREAVRGREAVANWFIKKAASCGFMLDQSALQVADIFVDRFKKDGFQVTLSKARITGILNVTDKTLFTKSVRYGIGHGKAFGCGLLQIVPLA